MIEKRQPRRDSSTYTADLEIDEAEPEATESEAAPTEDDSLDELLMSDSPPAAALKSLTSPERLLERHDIDSLPVKVQIDVGTVELTVRELRELAPGTILQLGRPLQAPAIVTINGRTIATADLVDVNGQLGARLLTLVR